MILVLILDFIEINLSRLSGTYLKGWLVATSRTKIKQSAFNHGYSQLFSGA